MDLVQNELEIANAEVEVVTGGTRGIRVTVIIPEDDRSSFAKLETALASFLFESKISVG